MMLPAPTHSSDAGRLDKIGLGTVQFGLPYGISNVRGQVEIAEVMSILKLAAELGIIWLDTAADYGTAEAVLGAAIGDWGRFRVITKTLPLGPSGIDAVIGRVAESSRLLRRRSLDALLVHGAGDLNAETGAALWQAMQSLKRSGAVQKIGISAYFDQDPLALAQRYAPDLMQISVSILDQRMIRSGDLERIKQLGVQIHARSVFTQGLLFLTPDQLPPKLAHGAGRLAEIKRTIASGGASLMQAALGFVLDRSDIDLIVVGVTNTRELAEIVAVARGPRPIGLDWEGLALEDPLLIDPRAW